MALERLQKILARGGVASRRATEDLILAGRVRVNGRVVTELGTKADTHDDKVELDGKRIVAQDAVYVLCHKPRGVVATMSDPEGRPTMATMLSSFDARLFPVGRLDFATSGALLATNDGAFSDGLLHPKRAVPKTYIVKVNGVMQKEHLDRWRHGLELDDGPTQPAEVNFLRHEGDKTWFELTIKEGRNQQIRRMGEASGFLVMRLSRVAFAGITTEGLPPGGVRPLTRDELGALKKSFGVPKKMPTTFDLARAREEAAGPRRAVRSRPAQRVEADGDRRPRPSHDEGGGFREPGGERGSAPPRRGERPSVRGPREGGPAREPRSDRAASPVRRGERPSVGEAPPREYRPGFEPRSERAAGPTRRGTRPTGRGPGHERGPGREPGGERGSAPVRRGERPSGRGPARERGPGREPGSERDRAAGPAPRGERPSGRGPARERGPGREPGGERDRAAGPAPRGERPSGRGPARERRPEPRGERAPAPAGRRGERTPAPTPGGAPRRERDHGGASKTTGARYGGGSPVRRGYDVTSDWGGGAGRGRTPEKPASRPEHGGRGTTRTTGTGGGPKAPPGPYERVKGRRG